MKKKLLPLLLLLALPLAGCKDDVSSTPSTPSTPSTTSVEDTTSAVSETSVDDTTSAISETSVDDTTSAGDSESPSDTPSTSDSETPVIYKVSFYSDDTLFTTVDVPKGEALSLPLPPTKAEHTFAGWHYDSELTNPYSPFSLINADFNLYAKWTPDVPAQMQLHIIGEPQNSDLATISWETLTDYHADSLLVYSETNLHYQIILELGYGANFKIKEPGKQWNDFDNHILYGVEYGYGDLEKTSSLDKLSEGENGNIIVLIPGFYTITATPEADSPLHIYFNSAATSPGVTPLPPQTFVVRFYKDKSAATYYTYEVDEGAQVTLPPEPAIEGLIFAGWYIDREYNDVFDEETPITADLNVYAKWENSDGEVVHPDDTLMAFHVIGGFGEEDGADWWDVTGSNDYFHLEYDASLNVYKTTRHILLGHGQEFKVKEIGKDWDAENSYIFDFDDIDPAFAYSYLERGDLDNVRVTLAGNYEIILDVNAETLKVTWVKNYDGNDGDAYTITSSPWGIVGTHNAWGDDGSDTSMRYDKVSGTHFRRAMYFEEGAQWKIRKNNEWGEPWENPGAHPGNTLEGMSNAPEGADDNIIVNESGYYTVVFDGENFTVAKTRFALRGNVVASSWDADSIPFALVNILESNTYEYELTLALTPGEYRFKLAQVGDYSGLDYSPPHDSTVNYKISETYTYKLTLKITYSAVSDTFAHTFTATQM